VYLRGGAATNALSGGVTLPHFLSSERVMLFRLHRVDAARTAALSDCPELVRAYKNVSNMADRKVCRGTKSKALQEAFNNLGFSSVKPEQHN